MPDTRSAAAMSRWSSRRVSWVITGPSPLAATKAAYASVVRQNPSGTLKPASVSRTRDAPLPPSTATSPPGSLSGWTKLVCTVTVKVGLLILQANGFTLGPGTGPADPAPPQGPLIRLRLRTR